jgi:protein TIF31
MAGKSNKGKNRKGSQSATNLSEQAVSSDAPLNNHSGSSDANGIPDAHETNEVKEVANVATEDKAQGEINTNTVEKPMQDEAHATAEHKAKQGEVCSTPFYLLDDYD